MVAFYIKSTIRIQNILKYKILPNCKIVQRINALKRLSSDAVSNALRWPKGRKRIEYVQSQECPEIERAGGCRRPRRVASGGRGPHPRDEEARWKPAHRLLAGSAGGCALAEARASGHRDRH